MSEDNTARVTPNSEFQHRRFTQIADRFVEIYEEDEMEAARYAKGAVKESDYGKLRMYITNAFVRAGWSFD